jgi:hypothetical protein
MGTMSEAEREARRKADREKSRQAVEALVSSEGWQSWLRCRRHFHRYSLANQLLIAMQCPVAGFRTWLKLGYCARRGETALRIWVPMSPSKRELERLAGRRRRSGAAAAHAIPAGTGVRSSGVRSLSGRAAARAGRAGALLIRLCRHWMATISRGRFPPCSRSRPSSGSRWPRSACPTAGGYYLRERQLVALNKDRSVLASRVA